MKTNLFLIVFVLVSTLGALGQVPSVVKSANSNIRSTSITTKYLTPTRVVWVSGEGVQNAESILKPGIGQADLNSGKYLTLNSENGPLPGIILDFGCEIHGGIEIVTTINNKKPTGKIRVRFGESVSETNSTAGEQGASNDHAIRDFEIELPWLGRLEVGNSGFRFVRIDLVGTDTKIEIKEINAALKYRDIPYLGSFTCNDERLNKIWMTGAYTVHLNMQDYLWDGIKRDRLVWIGDMHPEVMTINSVFGNNEVVPKSLDLARELTPLPNWMNGISSYSMWWILIQRDWYYYQGDLHYLEQQKEYLVDLLDLLSQKIDDTGKEILDGNRFLDWPSSENKEAVHAGLQALMIMTFEAGAELCGILGDRQTADLCNSAIKKLEKHVPDMAGSKQAAALLAMSGLVKPQKADKKVLSENGVHNMSTFYGYYMLKAKALAENYGGAINDIRNYWGAMLDLGATTFWEDFDIYWTKNAGRIDEIVPEGKVDVHAAYGNYCYKKFRHSFCHGWASGPTSWLTEYVLGVKVLEAGCKKIKIEPHLGDLEWAKGTFPTPMGVVKIEHKKKANGTVETIYEAPDGVEVMIK